MFSDDPMEEAEKQVLLKVLQEADWDYNKAMNRLKISRTTLWRKMRKHEIEKPSGYQ
jgi:transcriptional regulator of acetoin/glycerol metabolism